MHNALNHDPLSWIDLGHTRLPHWRIGTGPDLVFVHGWPLDARTWRRVIEPLTSEFTCHMLDLPGAGRSEWTDQTPGGMTGMVDVLSEALERMDLGPRFGLVGHDSGGTFVRLAGARIPGRISGMVLGNTEIPGHHPWRLKLLLAYARSRWLRRTLPAVLRSRLGRWLLLRDCVSDRSLIERELTPLFIAPLNASKRKLAGAMGMASSVKVEDFDEVADAHPRITAPVKLVWGVDDPWFPVGKCRGMLEQFGGPATLVAVSNAKLLVHEEHPERFAAEIAEHFGSSRASSGQRAGGPFASADAAPSSSAA